MEAQTEKISEMASVMMQAAKYMEKEETQLEETITRLKTENQVFFSSSTKMFISKYG